MPNKRCLLLLFSSLALGLAQTGGSGRAGSRSDGSSIILEKERLIRAELLKLSNHPWAGEYYYGDGLGVNVSLLIAPAGGFVFTWHGCLGLYDWNHGNVRVARTGASIELLFTRANQQRAFQGIAPTLVPVVWGERRYLIPADEMVGFANEVNSGFEPRQDPHGRFLLKKGDERREALGEPALPSEYLGYLLRNPITAAVLAVGETRSKKLCEECGSPVRITTVTLDAGSAKGVRVGMEFYLRSPDRVYESAKVLSVGGDESIAEITQFSDGPSPSKNWKLSTRTQD
jgi:hypothetical protein